MSKFMQNRLVARVVPALLALSFSSVAAAHLGNVSPPTRYEFEPPSGNNQKVGPCATGTPTGVVTELVAGEQLTVSWDETVNHPGHFRVSLDLDGGDDFPDPASENDMAVTGNVIAYVPDDGGSSFSHTFTVPNQNCDPCSIQVIQVMTDKLPWGPENGDDLYYWCSDIRIIGATGTGTGTGSGSTTGTGSETGTGTGTGTDTGSGGGDAGGGGSPGGPGNGADRDFSSADDGCTVGRVGDDPPIGGWAALTLALTALWNARRRR